MNVTAFLFFPGTLCQPVFQYKSSLCLVLRSDILHVGSSSPTFVPPNHKVCSCAAVELIEGGIATVMGKEIHKIEEGLLISSQRFNKLGPQTLS